MSSPASRSEPVRGDAADAAVSRDAPRQRILDAGEQVFADKGYARATVDDVIVMAATSRATFYRYFESKDDLFKELSRACFVEMRSVIRDLGRLRPAANGPGELAAVVSSYAELHQRHGGVIRAWTERAAPPDSPLKDDAARVFGALLDEAARAISAARGTAGAGTAGAGLGIGPTSRRPCCSRLLNGRRSTSRVATRRSTRLGLRRRCRRCCTEPGSAGRARGSRLCRVLGDRVRAVALRPGARRDTGLRSTAGLSDPAAPRPRLEGEGL